ncbi:MAG: DEAD/DEAH box helicase [Candidatus Portnoybacteria bacterium]|nr:DEAD/DEAH box helicase [Candidatus Portnoybacteria bacterium]
MSKKNIQHDNQLTLIETDINADRFRLRWYQQEAVDAMMSALMENDRHPACIAATGAGKTVIMGAFIERYLRENPNESVLVLAHRAGLITQAAERFSHILPHDLVPAIHCASLGKKEFGKVTVASVQTIGKPDVLNEMPAPGLVIVDEAHRIPTEGNGQYQRLIKALSARHRDMRVSGFTATPWRLDGGHIVGPDNPLNYTAYQIEPHTLMAEKFLVKPQWANTLYPIETGKARSRKGDFLNEDLRNAATIQHKERMQDVLTRTADRQHNIVFTIDRKHARLVAASLPDSVVIDGSMLEDARDQRLQDFSDGKYRYLVNVDLFIEGFDLPKIDSVTVLRPTQSAARWIQMVGRGLRTNDGKTDCLVLDYGGNIDRFPMRPDEPGFFNYDPKGSAKNVPGTLVKGPANPETPVELPAPLTMNVTRVDASVFHSNHKDRDFLKVRYFIGMTSVDQTWVIPSKDFADFWTRHGFGNVPKNPIEAKDRIQSGDLLLPRAVSMRYRPNPNKPFGFSEIVSEVHSWAETMKNRHIFFTVPSHEAGESSGYNPKTPGFIRPTPIYGQQIYAKLVQQDAVPATGQWVTAYPTNDGQPVHFEQPIMLYNNRTGMSYVAEKSELDQMLQHKMTFRPIAITGASNPMPGANPMPSAGLPGANPYTAVSDRQVSLLAPHEAGNMGFICAQKSLWDGARYWWGKAAEQGDVSAQKNLEMLNKWQPVQPAAPIEPQDAPIFAYGGRRP